MNGELKWCDSKKQVLTTVHLVTIQLELLQGAEVPFINQADLEMQRAMAKQAEAEREKRAKIISAEGELLASQKLSEAAAILGSQKDGITLRYLETMREIAGNGGSSTTFFPFPIDILSRFLNK